MRLNSPVFDAVATQRNLSNRQIALRAGVNPRFLGRLRKGERTASKKTIQKLADVVAIDLDLILLPHEPVKEPQR